MVVGAGDGSAAHLGAACTEPGDTYLCLGSSTWLVTQTDRLIFDEKGRMVISPVITEENRHLLGLDRDFIIPLTEKHQPFMEWHRKMYQEALNQMKD